MDYYEINCDDDRDEDLRGLPVSRVRAVKTGEHRYPSVGEWSLYGGQAYKAHIAMSSSFDIVTLVEVKLHYEVVRAL